jgi:uncharacterized protein YgbK (DUF1537 family)
MILGCIADDFTGATDLAALLVRAGVPVSLRIGLPDRPGIGPGEGVEVVALKIRSVPADQAVAQALAALDWLRAAGARHVYWKYCSTFDSTPRGNIGPVTQALLARLRARQTLYVPSFPENGRRVFMGNMFVGDQPLAESPMKDHPLNQMTDSDLTRVLAAQLGEDADKVGLIDWPTIRRGPEAIAEAMGRCPTHMICDAIEDADLAALARVAHHLPLLTGSSAFAGHLPAAWRAAGLLAPAGSANALPPLPQGPALVLSGSCSAMTRRQVAEYAGHAPALKLDPLRLAAGDDGGMADWLAARLAAGDTPIIHGTAEPAEVAAAQAALGPERAGALVEDTLARAATLARRLGVARFVVAGGETSGAITSALGVTALNVGAEIAPGVPWCAGEDGAGPLALALKSGNFGDESFFDRALAAAG